MTREQKWACWWALLEGIVRTPSASIPRQATIDAFRQLTEELGEAAAKRLDDRIEHERIHNVSAFYALQDAKGESNEDHDR